MGIHTPLPPHHFLAVLRLVLSGVTEVVHFVGMCTTLLSWGRIMTRTRRKVGRTLSHSRPSSCSAYVEEGLENGAAEGRPSSVKGREADGLVMHN